MIQRIKTLSLRAFQGFTWPGDLDPFGRFNLIYGWNGSGKTTVSSMLRGIELRTPVPEGDAELEIDGHTVNVQHLPTSGVPTIRVFNKDFTANAVLKIETELAPIYYFGEESVEKRKKVEHLKRKLTEAESSLEQAEQAEAAAGKALDRFCVEQAKQIKQLLTGSRSPNWCNNYDKKRFRATVENLSRSSALDARLDKAQEQQAKGRKDGQPKPPIQPPALSFDSIGGILAASADLVSRSVVSEGIQELISDADLGAWVQQGLGFHTGVRVTDHCHFCSQPLPELRVGQLERHFSKGVTRFQADVDSLVNAIADQINALSSVDLPRAGEVYNDLETRLNLASSVVLNGCRTLRAHLSQRRAALIKRRNAPLDAPAVVPEGTGKEPSLGALQEGLCELLTIVTEHNERSARFSDEIAEACSVLEHHYVSERLATLGDLHKKVEVAGAELGSRQGAPGSLRREIERIEREIVEHQRPAEELNNDLRSYLGRDEFRLLVKESGYILMRGDEPATNLSEGEKTAFALLYFLKSLGDKSSDLKRTVVVIDDPVSSLDANSLFSSFSFIKERTKDAGQLIVLTHNFAFFRQVRNWFHHLPGQRSRDVAKRPGRFYMVVAESEGGRRSARLTALDRLLEEYESEYHFLFKCVYAMATQPTPLVTMDGYYGIPNVARRLIEAFLAFRFPQVTGDLWAKLAEVDFDPVKKTRILRLLHTYSHAGSVIEPEHDPAVLAETKLVLPELLQLIEKTGPDHYSGMLEAIRATSAPASGG